MERAGYYHAEVGPDATIFRTHRGGIATMTPSGGTAAPVASNQQVTIMAGESPAKRLLLHWSQARSERPHRFREPPPRRSESSRA